MEVRKNLIKIGGKQKKRTAAIRKGVGARNTTGVQIVKCRGAQAGGAKKSIMEISSGQLALDMTNMRVVSETVMWTDVQHGGPKKSTRTAAGRPALDVANTAVVLENVMWMGVHPGGPKKSTRTAAGQPALDASNTEVV